MRKSVQHHIGPARERTLNIPVLLPSVGIPSQGHRGAASPAVAQASSLQRGCEAEEIFLAAVLHRRETVGSSAISARSTSVSYSLLISGVAASKR